MKDFCKWLGVNEKIAKIIMWMFIFMAFLILFNTMLESIGFPYYRLNVDNLSKVNYNKIFDYGLSWIMCLLNFYSVIFLLFRIKDFKKIFGYSILYLLVSISGNMISNSAINQIILFLYVICFCYFYSKKNWKYIFYGIGAYLISVGVQYIVYLYKIRFIDFTTVNYLNRLLLSLDYFIIMAVMILVKEIIIKNKLKVEVK